MPKIIVERSFKHADDGMTVREYAAGETADVSERCAEVALAEGWAKAAPLEPKVKAETKPRTPKPAAEKPGAGPQSPGSGQAQPASSSQAAQASQGGAAPQTSDTSGSATPPAPAAS